MATLTLRRELLAALCAVLVMACAESPPSAENAAGHQTAKTKSPTLSEKTAQSHAMNSTPVTQHKPALTVPQMRTPHTATPAKSAATPHRTPKLDVGYGPTPKPLIRKMLTMAKVGPDDLLMDLGCGDGRIVIQAAKQCKCKGIGIDLDPKWVTVSRSRAQKAGVQDLVTFEQGDLFKAELSRATVLTLYLRQSLNLRLRPRLFEALRPGTRVLSVNHTFGRWRPDDVVSHGIHRGRLYVIPAHVAGTWRFTLKSHAPVTGVLTLRQRFQELTGAATVPKGASFKATRLRGTNLATHLTLPVGKKRVRFTIKATVRGETMTGTALGPQGKEALPFSAIRTARTNIIVK